MNAFDTLLDSPLESEKIHTLQVNTGLLCNQACTHCHLQCSPVRTEIMSWHTMEQVIAASRLLCPECIDITGGAPELNTNLQPFISALRQLNQTIQLRTNLTALYPKQYRHLIPFFSTHDIRLVASLPCYLSDNVTAMRGREVFDKSIIVLRELNKHGYGSVHGPALDLVFNPPAGPCLPPDQKKLEQEYKDKLDSLYGIQFSTLLTLTNMPVGRYLENLKKQEQEEAYLRLLKNSFNRETVADLMCRHQINVGWDGLVYDCDFNQALGLPVSNGSVLHISQCSPSTLVPRKIVTGSHCFACTAGAGSSCTGALSG